jgi:hypothetical protein
MAAICSSRIRAAVVTSIWTGRLRDAIENFLGGPVVQPKAFDCHCSAAGVIVQWRGLGVEEKVVLLVELIFGPTFLVFPLDPVQL